MQYKYLSQWAKETNFEKANIDSITKFEDQFFIHFKNRKQILQINLNSQNPFTFLTDKSNLTKHSVVVQSLTDHLKHGIISSIELMNNDRILKICFSKIDIYSKRLNFSLIIELINSYENIILINESENKIIDSWKKFSFADNNQRQILPGAIYQPPETTYENKPEQVNYPIKFENKKIIENSDSTQAIDSMNELFVLIFKTQIFQKKIDSLRNSKIKSITKQRKKNLKKIEKLNNELNSAEKEQEFYQKAELLKANFNQIRPQNGSVKLINYFSENMEEIEIELFPELRPKQNVEYYFKKYRKSRDGKEKIREQIEITEHKIEELEKEIFEIEENFDYFDLKESQKKKSKKEKKSKGFMKLKINDEWEIFIGRTSNENDQLTTKFAKPQDWWFHTRVFKGTHVILRNYLKKQPSEQLKFQCCQLAAYYSKAKKSSNVPVDFTQIRYVRKPKGSPPGFVIYKEFKTMYVDPISIRDLREKIETN